MSLNYQELALITEQLNQALQGGQIQRIVQPDAWTVTMTIRTPGETNHLLISCKPGARRISLTPRLRPELPAGLLKDAPPSAPPKGEGPPAFCMLLRKHCENGRITTVEMAARDRVCALKLRRGQEQFTIMAELTGHHGNIYLLGQGTLILGSVLPSSSRHRDNHPGGPYQLPVLPGGTPDQEESAPSLPSTMTRASRFTPEGILEEVEEYYKTQEEEALLSSLATELQRSLRTRLNRQKRLTKKIRRDLNRATEAVNYRQWGDLLLANLHTIKRGSDQARVADYFSEGMPTVGIPLDPAVSPVENAQRYFKQHTRLTKARDLVERRLKEATSREEQTERLWQETLALTGPGQSPQKGAEGVDPAMDPAALGDLWRRGEKLNLVPPLLSHITRLRSTKSTQKRRKEKTRQTERALPYRTFKATNGTDQIFIGRSAAGNDQLTFRVARGRDIWLHIRDFEGPHVVIPVRGSSSTQVSTETLLDGATLAIHFSPAGRREGVADVIWTRVRNLRRYPGGTPGKVSVSKEKVIRVKVEEDRLTGLLDQ